MCVCVCVCVCVCMACGVESASPAKGVRGWAECAYKRAHLSRSAAPLARMSSRPLCVSTPGGSFQGPTLRLPASPSAAAVSAGDSTA